MIVWSYENLEFLSWNITFWGQIFAHCSPNCKGYFYIFPVADEPKRWGRIRERMASDHAAARLGVCCLTSVNCNTSIVVLEIIKKYNFRNNPIVDKFQVWDRKTEYRCYKCDNTIKRLPARSQSVRRFVNSGDGFFFTYPWKSTSV